MNALRFLLLTGIVSAASGGSSSALAQDEMTVCGTQMNEIWLGNVIVTCNVSVPSESTLTIAPGTRVRALPDVSIAVSGILRIEGTQPDPVVVSRFSAAQAWVGIIATHGSVIITHATISGALTAVAVGSGVGSMSIDETTFTGNGTALARPIGGGPATIGRSTFENNGTALAGTGWSVQQSVIRNNTHGISSGANINVADSRFEGNTVAIQGTSGVVSTSLIVGNGTGIESSGAGLAIRFNAISGNGTGLALTGTASAVDSNSIFGNTTHDAEVRGAANVTATNNWWGTTVTAAIDAKIRDGRDDSSLGVLTYVPFLSTAHPDAPTLPTSPSTCGLTLTRPGGGLTLDFVLSTPEPATWSASLAVHGATYPIWSIPLPVLSAPAAVSVPFPVFPALGGVGVLTTLSMPARGIVCSNWQVVDTGDVAASSK